MSKFSPVKYPPKSFSCFFITLCPLISLRLSLSSTGMILEITSHTSRQHNSMNDAWCAHLRNIFKLKDPSTCVFRTIHHHYPSCHPHRSNNRKSTRVNSRPPWSLMNGRRWVFYLITFYRFRNNLPGTESKLFLFRPSYSKLPY